MLVHLGVHLYLVALGARDHLVLLRDKTASNLVVAVVVVAAVDPYLQATALPASSASRRFNSVFKLTNGRDCEYARRDNLGKFFRVGYECSSGRVKRPDFFGSPMVQPRPGKSRPGRDGRWTIHVD